MVKRKMPLPGTEEYQHLRNGYESGANLHILASVNDCTIGTLTNFASDEEWKRNVKRKLDEEASGPVVIPAPFVDIKPLPQIGDAAEGEEVHVQPIGDAHAGILTPTYNSEVLVHRMDKLQDASIKLALLHRKMRPVKKLIVPILGDMTHGEQYGAQGMVEEFEMGAEQQIFELLLPVTFRLITNWLQVYEQVEIVGVPGNHGNVQRKSQRLSKRTNWDTIFYRALAIQLEKYQDRVSVEVPNKTWYYIKEVNGWKFLLVHGDQIQSYLGTPFYGLERRALRWKQSIGVDEPFDYVMLGHYHNPNFLWNLGVPIFINGCMISDSDFPLVRMGAKDVPQQWSMFVNKKFGVTATYRIQL